MTVTVSAQVFTANTIIINKNKNNTYIKKLNI